MSECPAVSVVISTYNRAAVLRPALHALLDDQRAGDVTYEVIVVDNNSTDDTARMLDGFARAYSSVVRLRERRQGVSHGRNAGIAAALAPVIAFTDDDIRVAPDWIATIARLFANHAGIDCIGGPILPIWEATPPRWLDRRHWSPIAVVDYGPVPFEISAEHPRCLLTSNLALRARVFASLEPFSPRFPRAQDHELQLRYWLSGGRALYSPELVVRTEVPAARMNKAYYRRWHRLNGRMCARMRLRERLTPRGALRREPVVGHTLQGVPRFLFRELAAAVGGWVRSLWRGDASERFAYEVAAWHLVGYIAERWKDARGAPARTRRAYARVVCFVSTLDARRRAIATGRRRACLLVPDGAEASDADNRKLSR